MDGKSYYFAEVESVLARVRAKGSRHQHPFLLDELHGTDTTERVAAVYAVLASLNRGSGLVVVATHHLGLLDLLNGGHVGHLAKKRKARERSTRGPFCAVCRL